MSSVLPIDTQRYRSGPYILEVTSRASPLSQWSDRPVVRQLRFNLWQEQQQLVTGNQQQLMTVGEAVETYVQTHLTHQWWPQRHRLELLETTVELSTLQLFDLAEVLNAYGQRQIVLPTAVRRRRPRWWTGSAAASVIVAVGVTAAYIHYRPTAFDQVSTSQAPEAVFDEAELSEAAPETQSKPTESLFGDQADEPEEAFVEDAQPEQELAQQPLDLEEFQAEDSSAMPTDDMGSAVAPDDAPSSEESESPRTAPAEVAPAPASEPIIVTEAPAAEFEDEDLAVAGSPELSSRIAQDMDSASLAVLDAIASQLAPYQPIDVDYPVVYQVQIAADGQFLSLDPISEGAPTLEVPDVTINPSPGQALRAEVTYTGSARPTVIELP